MALLLYPRARSSLPLLTASDWRQLFAPISPCDLEVVGGKEAKITPVQNLEDHLSRFSCPVPLFSNASVFARSSHFIEEHRHVKRMLYVSCRIMNLAYSNLASVLAGGDLMTSMEQPFRTYCRWWRKRKQGDRQSSSQAVRVLRGSGLWRVQLNAIPSPLAVRQSLPDSCERRSFST